MAAKKTTTKEMGKLQARVLRTPRITEKATIVAEKNVYTFNVDPKATKSEIVKAIQALYDVTPVKVAVVNRPARKVFVRGKLGTKSGSKKAMVYLKKGDKIDFA